MSDLTREQLKASLELVARGEYVTEGSDENGDWYLNWNQAPQPDVLCLHDDEYEIDAKLTPDQMRGLHAALTLRLLELE